MYMHRYLSSLSVQTRVVMWFTGGGKGHSNDDAVAMEAILTDLNQRQTLLTRVLTAIST